jgi:thiamine-monophosphate kinase
MLRSQLQFDAETTAELRNAFLHPWPRVADGRLLVEHGVETAIDISDGLISDLKHICKASQVGARVEIGRVPISSAVRANFGDKALELSLSGGEDYELLFTASAEVIDKVKEAASGSITVIGEIIADRIGEVALLDANGKPFHLGKTGWEHFSA